MKGIALMNSVSLIVNRSFLRGKRKMDKKEFSDYCQCQLKEIEVYKWIESEKAGHDLGNTAIFEWIKKYAKKFRDEWEKTHPESIEKN